MQQLKVEPDERGLLQQLTAMFDAPAYIRRARHVERAYEDLIERCARKRMALLAGVRLHLGWIFRSAKTDELLQCGVEVAESIAVVTRESGWRQRENVTSNRLISNSSLCDLQASIARFNRRWSAFLEQLDLSEINRLRDGYNRYYLLEKECAVGSERLASLTFRRLEPVTIDELRDRFPLLPMP
jgi:hypothetical protein